MKPLLNVLQCRPVLAAVLMSAALMSGCGGGGSDADPAPVPVVVPSATPTVTSVTPPHGATGVSTNLRIISAAFSREMNPASLNGGTFTVVCPGGAAVPGNITYVAASRTATFTPVANLPANTFCTATLSATDTAGIVMASTFVWTFTTSLVQDATRPTVLFTVPATSAAGPTSGVPTNTAITAVFSEDVAPASVSGSTFTVTCAAPCAAPPGSVSHATGSRTATFLPAAALAGGTTYTATLTTGITDLAGNALAGNQASLPSASHHVWTFTTAGPSAPAHVSVSSTNPTSNGTGVCPSASINATFTVADGLRMNPLSVTSATFTLTSGNPAVAVTAASVTLDAATGRIATFTPLATLAPGRQYTALLKGGAAGMKDVAVPANALANDVVWTFTTATGACAPPQVLTPISINLGSAASFGAFGGSGGITSMGKETLINGDVGTTAASTLVTGLHDAGEGCSYTETPLNLGTVNGRIYTSAPAPTPACPSEGNPTTAAVATQARADVLAAYNTLAAQPGGPDPGSGNLGGFVLAPGVYTAAAGAFAIQGADLTLDAQGNPNAVWVFQMATTLTVGGPDVGSSRRVHLINGARAGNVYWQVGTSAIINPGGGGTMVGTLIAQAGVTLSTAGNVAPLTLIGRALSLGASVAMVNTVINVL